MGLFSTVLHIYKRGQPGVVNELTSELRQNHGFLAFSRLGINSSNYQSVLDEIFDQEGLFYLITQLHGNWITIIELNVNIDNPFYLYELTNTLSQRVNTYALSFHLHDDDILLYNLDKQGEPLDGYNSNYQYFLTEAAPRDEILTQRHAPQYFSALLPATKNIETLNAILNEGYWNAFDSDDLDKDGVPNDDKYFIDEENRFERIGKYLEIYSGTEYPYANWLERLTTINLVDCYLLKAER